jgi:hypothetical protein
MSLMDGKYLRHYTGNTPPLAERSGGGDFFFHALDDDDSVAYCPSARTYRHLPVLSSFTVIVILYNKRSRYEVLDNEVVVALGLPLTYRAISRSDLSSDLAVFNDVSPLKGLPKP